MSTPHNDNPDPHHRRSIRLQGYNYSLPGAYFVTMCVQNRVCLFGEIENGKMVLNEAGRIVYDEWVKSAELRNEIKLDEFVVMPNHLHGIIMITEPACKGDRRVAPTTNGPKPNSIGAMIAGFKSAAAKRINCLRRTPGVPVWQRNYYEHIIRNEDELNRVREYIINNPLNWHLDENYTETHK